MSYEIGCLLDLDVPRRKELEWLLSVLSEGKAQKPILASARYFDQSDFLVHTRSSFHFSARACSPRTVASESINNEGRRSHFLGHGATCLMRHGGEYLDIFPVWGQLWATSLRCPAAPKYEVGSPMSGPALTFAVNFTGWNSGPPGNSGPSLRVFAQNNQGGSAKLSSLDPKTMLVGLGTLEINNPYFNTLPSQTTPVDLASGLNFSWLGGNSIVGKADGSAASITWKEWQTSVPVTQVLFDLSNHDPDPRVRRQAQRSLDHIRTPE